MESNISPPMDSSSTDVAKDLLHAVGVNAVLLYKVRTQVPPVYVALPLSPLFFAHLTFSTSKPSK